MIVIPVDIEAVVQCAVVAVVFEVLRMGIAYILAKPSKEVLQLESDKFDAQAEVAKIKSVQLEFVKHSLLTRKVISIEKKIEGLQALYYPRLLFVRKVCRIVRVVVYVAVGVYFGTKPLIQINPLILWPLSWILSWFTTGETMDIHAWLVVFVLGGTVRHILRTLLPMVFSTTTFP